LQVLGNALVGYVWCNIVECSNVTQLFATSELVEQWRVLRERADVVNQGVTVFDIDTDNVG